MADLCGVGVSIVTVGQYLRPTRDHLPVSRYWAPKSSTVSAPQGRRRGGTRRGLAADQVELSRTRRATGRRRRRPGSLSGPTARGGRWLPADGVPVHLGSVPPPEGGLSAGLRVPAGRGQGRNRRRLPPGVGRVPRAVPSPQRRRLDRLQLLADVERSRAPAIRRRRPPRPEEDGETHSQPRVVGDDHSGLSVCTVGDLRQDRRAHRASVSPSPLRPPSPNWPVSWGRCRPQEIRENTDGERLTEPGNRRGASGGPARADAPHGECRHSRPDDRRRGRAGCLRPARRSVRARSHGRVPCARRRIGRRGRRGIGRLGPPLHRPSPGRAPPVRGARG